ncbi:MAG: CHAD domain-containing protein [Myxococcota bacterium]
MAVAREVELKLEASTSDLRRLGTHPVVTALAVSGAVTRVLESRYFDSADDRLAAAGFALRLRRDGDTSVQTLKGGGSTVGGLFERVEIEVPFHGERPDLGRIDDGAMRAAVEETLGGAPLVERFRTEFERSTRVLGSGESAFRVDIDRGQVIAGDARMPIHEVELELVTGTPAALFEFALMLQEHFDVWMLARSKAERGHALARAEMPRAQRKGRVDLPAGANVETALGGILSHALHQWTVNADLAADGSDPEGVHQMRVGVRRLRAALRGFRKLLPQERVAVFRSELRWLGQMLGPVRDLDVFLSEVIQPLEAGCGHDEAFKRLREEALALRDECQSAATHAIRSQRHTRLALEIGSWIAAAGWRNQPVNEVSARLFDQATDYADKLLSSRRRSLKRRGATLPTTDAERHAVRLRVKRLRYLAESVRDLYPETRARRFLKPVARLQRALGRSNDCATVSRILRVLLERLGDERMPAHDQMAGFVNGWMVRHAERALADADEAWERFRSARPFWKGKARR